MARDTVRRAARVGRRGYLRVLGRVVEVAVPGGVVDAMGGLMTRLPLTPEHVLLGYAQGMFPMEHRGRIHWYCPDPRAILPLDRLHVPSRDRTYLRKGMFDFRFDTDPNEVLHACAGLLDDLAHRTSPGRLPAPVGHGRHAHGRGVAGRVAWSAERSASRSETCSYLTPHIARFGAVEIPREEYRQRLARGMVAPASFGGAGDRPHPPSDTPIAVTSP